MSIPDLPHEAYLTSLAALDGVGPRRLMWLLERGSPAKVFQDVRAGRLRAAPRSLQITDELRATWRRQASTIDPAQMWQRCQSLDVGVLSLGSPGYPPRLAVDLEPPVVLFHRGDPDVLSVPTVGIVGTRRPTGYGRRTAGELGAALTRAGVAVVSGLALGIDVAAHRGALTATGSAPVAVVGAGLDEPCPVRNRATAHDVAARGVLFSEVPPGVPAAPWRFPVRNRVIAALCDALVVVESSPSGGSMHTVREALDRNTPVLSVPGPIDSPASAGTNLLLRDGAQPVLSAEDVLAVIGVLGPPGEPQLALTHHDPRPEPTGDAAAVLEEIGWRPVSVASLSEATGVDPVPISAALTQLEDAGWVRRRDGWIERVARAGPHS